MASNSLLECLVFANATANYTKTNFCAIKQKAGEIPDWDESRVTNSDEDVVLVHNWLELRRLMWDYVGIVRTDKRLARAARRNELLKRAVYEYYSNYRVNRNLIELRNLIHVAELVVRAAR